MRTLQSLLTTLLLLFSISAGFSQVVTWQMHAGQGLGKFIPGPEDPTVRQILTELYGPNAPQHGDPGGYQYANIPPADDDDWGEAPVDPEDGQLCFRLDRSEVVGIMTQLDFTYFQTFITVADPNKPFIIRYDQVDDGVRAYVFNEQYPDGAFLPDGDDDDPMPDGDARLYVTPIEADLSPLLVRGENRIVLVQFDNASTANYLKVVVPEDESCADDTEAPQIFNLLEDGTEVLFSEYLQMNYDCGETPFINPFVVDNCDFNPVLDTNTIVIPNTNGITTVILQYTATDASGNAHQEAYTYFIQEDNEAPEIFVLLEDSSQVLLSEYMQATYECGELPSLNFIAVDDCDPDPDLSFSLVSEINPDSSETFRLNIQATDASGKQTEAEYFYTVFYDLEAPEIFVILEDSSQVLFSEYIQESYECGAFPSLNLIAEDDCDPDPELSFSLIPSLNPDNSETFQLDILAVDTSGNETQQSYTFTTFTDTEAPIIEGCTDSLTVTLDLCNQYELTLEDLGISISDNCSDSLVIDLGPTMFEGPGTTTVKLTATDEVGLESTCEVVIITETNPELITVVAEDDVLFMEQGNSITFSAAALVANDSTSDGSVPEVQDLTLLDPGIGTLTDNEDGTFTFEPDLDFFGVAQLSYTAVVEYVAPDSTVLACEPDFSDEAFVTIEVAELFCDLFVTGVEGTAATCPGEATGTITIMTSGSDNELEYSIDGENFQLSNVFNEVLPGRYRITVREVESQGCIATASVTVREQRDVDAPTITGVFGGPFEFQFVDIDQDLPLDTVQCGSTSLEPWSSLTATDNCDPNPTLDIRADSTLSENGDLFVTYTLTAMDVSGNVNVKTVSIVRLKAELVCPTDTIMATLDSNGVFIPEISVLGIDTTCFGDRISIEPAEITSAGISAVTVTATDLNGNTSSCSVLVEVEDNMRPFTTTWQTTTEDPEVIIYTSSEYTYNYSIDWGDGTVEENVTGDIAHTYADHSAPQTVSISGDFPHFLASTVDREVDIDPLVFSVDENAEQLRSVEQWGDIQWSSFSHSFAFTEDFSINATDLPDLSNVSSLRAMFLSSGQFNSNISAWEVGNVTDMHAMFFGASAFNQDISSWDVSNVTDMRLMFSSATVFNQDIGSWEPGNVLDMNFMFSNTGSFNQNIGGWDVSNVTHMGGMFLISNGFNGDIGSWDVKNVTRLENMFLLASNFNQNLGGWDLRGLEGNATSAADMLSFCGMDTDNYDATLNGWSARALQALQDSDPGNDWASGQTIGAGGLFYSCAGKAGRDGLTNTIGWTISGDALNGSCPPEGLIERPIATSQASSMHLFPNPVSNVLNIKLNGEQLDRVELRDQLGRVVWSQVIGDDRGLVQVQVGNSKFQTGLYSVMLFNKEGLVQVEPLSIIK